VPDPSILRVRKLTLIFLPVCPDGDSYEDVGRPSVPTILLSTVDPSGFVDLFRAIHVRFSTVMSVYEYFSLF
jgi:hypothetical protein